MMYMKSRPLSNILYCYCTTIQQIPGQKCILLKYIKQPLIRSIAYIIEMCWTKQRSSRALSSLFATRFRSQRSPKSRGGNSFQLSSRPKKKNLRTLPVPSRISQIAWYNTQKHTHYGICSHCNHQISPHTLISLTLFIVAIRTSYTRRLVKISLDSHQVVTDPYSTPSLYFTQR
jgi:hypothetical protein